jgi:hypothetical protein
LLNEFDKKKLILSGIEFGLWFIKEDAWKGLLKYRNYESNVSISYAISKSYWFIERLVKNDKIDLSKSWIEELPAMYGYDYESVECKSDRLLMLLSIQEKPIEFLISILKIS